LHAIGVAEWESDRAVSVAKVPEELPPAKMLENTTRTGTYVRKGSTLTLTLTLTLTFGDRAVAVLMVG